MPSESAAEAPVRFATRREIEDEIGRRRRRDQGGDVPIPQFPTAIEVDFQRDILAGIEAVFDAWESSWQVIRSEIESLNERRRRLREDATVDEDEMDRVLRELEQFRQKSTERMRSNVPPSAVQQAYNRVRQFARRKMRREFETAGLRPLLAEDEVERIVRSRVQESVRLIRSIPEQFHGEVERLVVDAVNEGKPVDELRAEIENKFRTPRNRARTIARDQTGSALGEMQRAQYGRNGLRRAEWITMRDERVRGAPFGLYPRAIPSHYARDGREFNLDQGLDGIFPGQELNCRCLYRTIRRDLDAVAEGEEPGVVGDPR